MDRIGIAPVLLLLAWALLTPACERRPNEESAVAGGTSEGTPRPADPGAQPADAPTATSCSRALMHGT